MKLLLIISILSTISLYCLFSIPDKELWKKVSTGEEGPSIPDFCATAYANGEGVEKDVSSLGQSVIFAKKKKE